MDNASRPAAAGFEQLLETALRAGAQAAEVFGLTTLSCPVLFEANRLKQLETRNTQGLALRVWCHNRPGLAVAYGSYEATRLVETAIALSQLNQPEEIELAHHNPVTTGQHYGTVTAVPQLIDQGKQVLAQLLQHQPQLKCLLELDCEQMETSLINSKGVQCAHTDITLILYGAVEWTRGEDLLTIEAEQMQRHHLTLEPFIQSMQQRLHWAKHQSPSLVGQYPVLFTGKAAELLWATVEIALNGKRVLEGASPWSDRLWQPVLAPTLTLRQDPQVGPYSCPFDDEGQATRRAKFIHQGELQLFYADRTVGRRLGSGSTGNGLRTELSHYPSPGLFHLMIDPGTHSFAELITCLDDGLIIDQVLGENGGISGDFAVSVDLGYRVKQGKIIGRVKDTLISGNVYDILRGDIVLGNDVDWYGPYHTPSILVNGLSVSA